MAAGKAVAGQWEVKLVGQRASHVSWHYTYIIYCRKHSGHFRTTVFTQLFNYLPGITHFEGQEQLKLHLCMFSSLYDNSCNNDTKNQAFAGAWMIFEQFGTIRIRTSNQKVLIVSTSQQYRHRHFRPIDIQFYINHAWQFGCLWQFLRFSSSQIEMYWYGQHLWKSTDFKFNGTSMRISHIA